jgi:PPE-repeat protein
MAAASAWDGLAAELTTAATGYTSVIDELTSSPWLGPASRTMIAAVAPYVSWMSTAGAAAEEAASQARAAAAAF